MSYIEIKCNEQIGWFCNNDLILISDRETFVNDIDSPFMDDNKLQLIYSSHKNCTRRQRYIPKVDFNDEKLFPSRVNKTMRSKISPTNEELLSELNSMLACREYVSKQNHFFDRKQFQQAQAAQADEEKNSKNLKDVTKNKLKLKDNNEDDNIHRM